MSFSTSVKPYGVGKLVTLASPALQITISTLGATIHSVKVFQPQQKRWVEVNMQYSSHDEALADCGTYFGATVGRFAGRVGNGRFVLDNVEYHTPKNAGEHTIHGGGNAFDKKEWGFVISPNSETGVSVAFNYTSPHMENGFPAELACKVVYAIDKKNPNALRVDFAADITDSSPAEATIVNMFNHAYWNLNGFPERDPGQRWAQAEPVHNHYLRMPNSDLVAETNSSAIPNGRLVPVKGALDFRTGCAIGKGIADAAALNRDPCGYDHPYFVSGWKPHGPLRLNAEVSSPSTGIMMQVYSTFPCVWVYTANNLKAGASGKPGDRFARYTAVAIEPQQLPDAANWKSFPQSVVRRGSPYRETMVNVFHVSSAASKV
ncbi:aldose 1-epimerase-like protein [Leptomonas pyrrhocoris]|uniref:Aldose 1-epimerase-like protein n=1 Tax=Leptomonas pyrrhocoris TaxID=157538 RepID=A0A0N0VHS9_LEPPY|nr:aldose 1-epimerase-like protein [Leptomonas pyrrhocoris]XP_015664416.1 aldose 1-epimerase-like protein [Leptomonas pyrrhocoris]XP_015664417.1 aldose 1-epimerase-like protein [Leptomonas pyrrhocoris]KPA85976.1 aldose 1-epimerase-like protein [Leptomonas pyrrhocoris]KPA85977.1 aldose 1-epimerase-like protein [Leptomonas pyrrhocoris]KPA85978.1 aldose 1-epimerase-like protein [Leptomonas pyrrhocoris]|eukprot:XP_015664415.1 aldose 1-epimerase-like protein [Leptomonas pyrrhocoris]